jgi:outer membrane protein assembly factor BamA
MIWRGARGLFASRRLILTLFGVALTLANGTARAQDPQSGDFRLVAIKFAGLKKFTDAQAIAGSGLRVGDGVTTTQLSVAANQLAKSGAFDEVAFQYSTRGNELTAVFTVAESRHLLPCIFDNFVWFSYDQLDKTVRARVPFYSGVAPLSGATQQQIIDALRAFLESNGITANVQGIPSGAAGSAPTAMLFRVLGVPMPIKIVNFPGSSAISEKELEAAATQAIGQDFSISNMIVFASAALVPLYREKGYLRAAFDRPQWAVIGNPPAGSSPDIALTLPVKEGSQYFWDKATWAGNHQFSSDELDQTLNMKAREVANQQKIDAGFEAVKKGYGKFGYIDVSLVPGESIDDTERLAAYNVTVNEGLQYHMGHVRFQGISDKAATEIAKKWALKQGDIYDATYPLDFLRKVAMPTLMEMRETKARTNLSEQRNKQNATVDVTIAFQ